MQRRRKASVSQWLMKRSMNIEQSTQSVAYRVSVIGNIVPILDIIIWFHDRYYTLEQNLITS